MNLNLTLKRIYSRLQLTIRLVFYMPSKTLYNRYPNFRKIFWVYKTKSIDRQWGRNIKDHDVLTQIILENGTQSIFDFGCGSGRLFPVFIKSKIPEILGQDISKEAIEICRNRYEDPSIKLTCASLEDLTFEPCHFDLVVCNRTLQHITENAIEKTLSILTGFTKAIYINEMADSDNTSKFYYMFKHDYDSILDKLGFKLVLSGYVENQNWKYYARYTKADKRKKHQT